MYSFIGARMCVCVCVCMCICMCERGGLGEGEREEGELYPVYHFSYLLGTFWNKWMELYFIENLPYTLHIYITHFICTATLRRESCMYLIDAKRRQDRLDQGTRIALLPRTFHCTLGRSM